MVHSHGPSLVALAALQHCFLCSSHPSSPAPSLLLSVSSELFVGKNPRSGLSLPSWYTIQSVSDYITGPVTTVAVPMPPEPVTPKLVQLCAESAPLPAVPAGLPLPPPPWCARACDMRNSALSRRPLPPAPCPLPPALPCAPAGLPPPVAPVVRTRFCTVPLDLILDLPPCAPPPSSLTSATAHHAQGFLSHEATGPSQAHPRAPQGAPGAAPGVPGAAQGAGQDRKGGGARVFLTPPEPHGEPWPP